MEETKTPEGAALLVPGTGVQVAEITVEDARHALWHAGDEGLGAQPGSFSTLLMRAFDHADLANRQKLWQEWPGLTSALVLVRSESGLNWLRDFAKGVTP